ncbi:MAG: hypothetical protein Q9181_000239 [Wetmoreana brouardii]
MVGGNPLHDRFGFRYWRDPGSFAEAYSTGSLGRFCGFLTCLVQASYTVSGPDYLSMAAGETENPRIVLPSAFKKVFGRLMAFFVLGSLAVGINAPYDSPELSDAFKNEKPGAAAILLISLISFLQVSSGSAVVLTWFVSIITASQLINFSVIAFTYTRFKKACDVQGLSRDTFAYKGRWQPFLAWYAFSGCITMVFLNGYAVFIHGNWKITSFFFSYTTVGVFPLLYFGWKILKRTKVIKPEEVDLHKDVEEIDEYTRNYVPGPPA